MNIKETEDINDLFFLNALGLDTTLFHHSFSHSGGGAERRVEFSDF